ncbi:CLUMA_CG005083, isoform A [Clunio marinus]|uniref:CLUMA_CG005083, isoform A n=1 Tax=Clunio marinus TaxID=568069 RepID=A0A1J1HV39_9DIPT|nr:CLUMA_CG005083, isoform A [Clunio marinus]
MSQNQKSSNNNLVNIDDQEYVIPYLVTRKVLNQDELGEVSGYIREKQTTKENIKEEIRNFKVRNAVLDFCPVLRWLPQYQIHKSLMNDIIAGITVAIMHIPQGMAYGLLAGVDPIVGLYMAFFPTLIYFLFGTSRHISTGTFAVVSLMTSKIVTTYSDPNHGTINPINSTLIHPQNNVVSYSYTPSEVATAVTMMTGFYQLIMCVLRLGTLSSLLSEALVNGFTTAAAIHVMVSQLKDLLGVKVPRHKGAFKIILSLRDIFMNISEANLNAVYVSIAGIIFMVIMNEFIKPWASKRCKFPVPSELIAVCGFTFISYILKLGVDYGVKQVGEIPTGLPHPEMPPFELLRLVAVDSIAVTIVSYSIVMSMALIFARKEQYEVRANQELLAMGLSNIFGSFFLCIPLACSLSRSLIQHQAGGKTQFASVVSAGLILIVLLWIGPLFETLPRATLAAIIIVALKGMVMQVKGLKRFKREGVLEMTVWLATFIAVVIIDIDIGLLIGVLVSLFALYLKGWKSYSCLLGQLHNTDIYIDMKTHQEVKQVPNIKIFHYCGSINFASRAGFKKDLFNAIGIDHRTIRRASLCETLSEARCFGQDMRTLIIDLSAVAHLDNAGFLLWIGPLFETLPRATLAAIIIVALKGMVMQVKGLKRFKREGVLEMTVWLATFIAVVIIDIDIGLLIGVLVSLFALYLKGWKSYSCLLGQLHNTDIYIDMKTHQEVKQIPNIKIFHYCGSINFASRAGFKKDLFNAIGIDHRTIRRASLCETLSEARCFGQDMRTLIIDLSAVAHLDNAGCKTFSEIKNELKLLDVKLYLAHPSDCVYDSLIHASQLGEPNFDCFATVHDAVLYAQGKPLIVAEL